MGYDLQWKGMEGALYQCKERWFPLQGGCYDITHSRCIGSYH